MNSVYVDDISKFLIGENTPFDTSIDTEDPLFVHLTTKNVEIYEEQKLD
jgi:hypothetical protein